jgi:very-short-patch-repair endonuclease
MMADYGEYVSKRLTAVLGDEMERLFRRRTERLSHLFESPIEALFAVSLDFSFWVIDYLERDTIFKLRINKGPLDGWIVLYPQYQWNEYRLDFAIFLPGGTEPIAFVECDGHEFHERTPEQAMRDRTRDRAVQHANIKIFRFTGRELHHKPISCAIEIEEFIAERMLNP